MAQTKPPGATLMPWLRKNGLSLAALTGQDTRALQAAVQCVHVYVTCDYEAEIRSLQAFALLVRCMQRSTRHLAFHAIAHVADWSSRSVIWERAGLESLEYVGRCKFEGQ